MDKNLEARINERIQQATDKNIIPKAYKIIEKFGRCYYSDEDGAKGYSFATENLSISQFISYDPLDGFEFHKTSIQYCGVNVFSEEDSKITSYNPTNGEWENLFEELYKNASSERPVNPRSSSKKIREAQIRRNWGL